MENPVDEIPKVIHLLTGSAPTIQQQTLEKFFTPNASFTHPFCRTGTSSRSRWLILCIYQWYKIMSPKIELDIKSVAFDEKNLILYVSISQIFRVWIIPFYSAPVNLTTVLQLTTTNPDPGSHSRGSKYWITSQNDLYQTDQFILFISPLRITYAFVIIWQYIATLFCVLGAVFLYPITWGEDNVLVHRGAMKLDKQKA